MSCSARAFLAIAGAADRSAIYLNALPLFTAGKVRLIDNRRLAAQLCGLERKTTALREIVNHPPGGKDDASNAACLALGLVAHDRRPALVRREDLLLHGAAPPVPKKVWHLAAVYWASETGIGAIVWGGLNFPGQKPDLWIVDAEVAPVGGNVFRRVLQRAHELMAECRANAIVFVQDSLQLHATNAGLPTEVIPADMAAEDRILSVSQHVATGSVKLCAPVLEKAARSPFMGGLDLRAGEGADDPLRAATILLIALALDPIQQTPGSPWAAPANWGFGKNCG
jgi:hypothetical protein